LARAVINRRLFSLRVAQNCGTRAYWAAHVDTSTLGLYTWDAPSGCALTNGR
jgi:hypothetical protein